MTLSTARSGLNQRTQVLSDCRPSDAKRADVLAAYRHVRSETERLCVPLEIEDYVVQTMPDASPTKWHLAHTTWFFEKMVLANTRDADRFGPSQFDYLFNSYYNSLGQQFPRPSRGLLSRPTVEEVYRYRSMIDELVEEWISSSDRESFERLAPLVTVGLHHEQQHQELILTDLKSVLGQNPLRPIYRPTESTMLEGKVSLDWMTYPGGVAEVGTSDASFAYDNESPRHSLLLTPYSLATRLVTVGEYLEFMESGGYRRAEWWLSDGWAQCRQERWEAPAYWFRDGSEWKIFTLTGCRDLVADEPVCHVCYYEADAYARWAGARLPREEEWEAAASSEPIVGNLLEEDCLHPQPAVRPDRMPAQFFGDVWEWTSSPYTAYPGYRPPEGPLSEYNGKFMCNQMILRGGSCLTAAWHIRSTYRNFFPPSARWQFSGIRLARDAF
ncbi:Iron(II)-dependent oxidoreductase EgtB [Planctomycetes bacterium Pan216]|uniref:Iron(II)-dependent oxidoreductase EgtB n=1 Tax=Kolteria novifilia TaxID=2527975 RepID=A0A518B4Z0_9BACT|nr:Iron(II)-dependent oxidoreductase EgtB [Planctomycetes bacterium Pan216]